MEFAKYVKIREEKFGAVIFDTLTEKVYITDESGKAILSLMKEGLPSSTIADRLGQDYEENPSAIRDDVVEFIADLQSAGLLGCPGEEKS